MNLENKAVGFFTEPTPILVQSAVEGNTIVQNTMRKYTVKFDFTIQSQQFPRPNISCADCVTE